VSVDVDAAVAQDVAGNDNTAASQFTITVDTSEPSPTISGPADPTGDDPFDVTIDFGESVTGFESGEITVVNGSVSGDLIDNDGGSYTASIDAASDGQVTVDVNAAVAQDTAGNNNTAAPQFYVTVDTVAPAPTIDQAAGQSDSASVQPVNFAVDFGEDVTGFESSDIIFGGSAPGSPAATVTGGPAQYNVAVSGLTGDGTLTINFDAAAAQDTAGNDSAAPTLTDNEVTFDGDPEIEIQRPAGTANAIADGDTDALGNQSIGMVTLTYTVDNTAGTDQLDISDVTADNLSNVSNFSLNTATPIQIAGGATGSFEISFDVGINGAFSFDLDIASNDGDENPYDIQVRGTGTGGAPEMDVEGIGVSINAGDSTPSIADDTDFGSADVSGGMVDHTFTIENTGSANLTINLPISISGANVGDFTMTADPATTIAPGGGTTSFTVRFDPGAVGQRDATISIANNDADENPYNFAIRGTGYAVPTATTDAAAGISTNGATLNGTVNAQNASTTVTFEYGLDTSYGATVTADQSPVTGMSDTAVSVALSGLTPDTTYHYRVVGQNAVGTTYGTDRTFTTTYVEMDVKGNGVSISAGDTTPEAADDTDFGDVSVGGSLDRTFSIQNEGSETLTLTDFPTAVTLTGSADFSIQTQPAAGSIPQGGADLDFVVRCTPSDTGDQTTTVSIANNDPDENPYNFNLECTGIAPEIDVQRPAGTANAIPDGGNDDLGNQSPGTQTLTYTVDNSAGSDQLSVAGVTAANLTNTSNFALNTAMPLDVAAGATGSFDISFDVDANGAFSLDIAIADNDSDENPYDITIQGTGQTLPEIKVQGNDQTIADGDTTPSADDHTDFGDVDATGATVTRVFTVKNTGSADLNLTDTPRVSIGGNHAADFTLTSDADALIPASKEITFEITFDPAAIGLREATISIANDDNDENPYEFSIQGTGSGPAPEMDVLGNSQSIPDGDTSPNAADNTDFGAVNLDDGAVSYTYTIHNSGSLDLNLTDDPIITIGGTHAAEFTLTIDANTPVAAGGGETTFEVTFDPRGQGLREIMVSIANDDSDENPYEFNIQGTGVTATVGGGGVDGENGEGNKPKELLAGVGSNGGGFYFKRTKVTVPVDMLTNYSNCQISISQKAGRNGSSLVGPAYDVTITCEGGQPATFNPPLEVCIKPTNDQLDAAGVFANLKLFHSHTGEAWNPLYNAYEENSYLCAQMWQLSYFTISVPEIPATGFPPGVVTAIEDQPIEKAYQGLGDFWLAIPSLGVELPIVGIPLTEDGWDVTWLGDAAGYLEGTAFPTWVGNTAITAHVYLSDGSPGPFVDLQTLSWGDEVVIHAWGMRHIYEVRDVTQVTAGDLSDLPHEDSDTLTLITCRGYNANADAYRWRVVVRAVLVDVEAE
ncbi:MAG: choice-of-anchor D domain-containing protein, partial [Chloroflexota bacterium]|nr:choice-of-anchor D domain-containing protein [Chloroflexota bacterium]